jgi:protein-tyrosine-phosphatase
MQTPIAEVSCVPNIFTNVRVDSAGTSGGHYGEAPDPAIEIAKK